MKLHVPSTMSLLLGTLAFAQAPEGGTALASSAALATASPDNTREKAKTMRVKIRVQGKEAAATLIDSPTTRDFISLLPLTLKMNDLFGREKYGHLPRSISKEGKRTHTYEVGDIVYWSPGPDVAIFYRQDGERIPDPGIIVIGKIESVAEILDVPGALTVTIERAK
jgi:hypothetical protein